MTRENRALTSGNLTPCTADVAAFLSSSCEEKERERESSHDSRILKSKHKRHTPPPPHRDAGYASASARVCVSQLTSHYADENSRVAAAVALRRAQILLEMCDEEEKERF